MLILTPLVQTPAPAFERTYHPTRAAVVTMRSTGRPDDGVRIVVRMARQAPRSYEYAAFNHFYEVKTWRPKGSHLFLIATRVSTRESGLTNVWRIDTKDGACRQVLDNAFCWDLSTFRKGYLIEETVARWVSHPPPVDDSSEAITRIDRFSLRTGTYRIPKWSTVAHHRKRAHRNAHPGMKVIE